MPGTLGRLSVEERERHLWKVFLECEEFKAAKEDEILEVFRYLRDLSEPTSPYKTKMRHPYAFAAAQAIKAQVWTAIFTADPAIQILDPNPENYPRNQITEKLLTGFIKNPLLTNFPVASEKVIDDAIWFGWSDSYTYFRSRRHRVWAGFEPETLLGEVLLDGDGNPVLKERYEDLRTYHAPWLDPGDVWDSFRHPDGRRGFLRRDVTGHELIAQAKGENPIYALEDVMRLINSELLSARARASTSFHAGTESMQNRDAMAAEVGVEPPRHDMLERVEWAKDVLSKPFVILHYDDGEYCGSYGVSAKSGFKELRFFGGVSYDGTPNRLSARTWQSPQEVYGTSFFSVAKDLLRFHSRMFQAAGDSMALQVEPMFAASNQLRMLGQELVFGPGAVIWTPHANRSVDEHFRRIETGADFVNTFATLGGPLKNDLDMTFGQSDPQRGLYQSGRRTAYESSQVAEGSQSRAEIPLKKLFNEFVAPLVRKWNAMATVHYTQRDFVRMLGPEGATYIPPSLQEICSSLSHIPKGSISLADQQLRRSQWPGILQMSVQILPYLQIPHMHELWKRVLEDMGQEAVGRVIPSIEDPRFTEYMMQVQQAQAMAGPASRGGQASPPRSPGDISGMLRSIGGRSAPPGPTGGNGNGSQGAGYGLG